MIDRCLILSLMNASYSLSCRLPGNYSKTLKKGKVRNFRYKQPHWILFHYISLIQYIINADVNVSVCLCCFLFVTIWDNTVTVWRLADFNFCTFLRQGVDLRPILFSLLTIVKQRTCEFIN